MILSLYMGNTIDFTFNRLSRELRRFFTALDSDACRLLDSTNAI